MFKVGAAIGLLAIALSGAAAEAQNWPDKPVKLIVMGAAGGSPDVAARVISDRLGKIGNLRFVVENKVGAGGITGWTDLKRSAPDGYTFGLIAASAYSLTPHLFKDLSFDVDRDFVPTAFVGTTPIVVAVKKESAFRSLEDLLSLSRQSGGKTAVATPPVNSLAHLLAELANARTEAKLNLVPFSTAPAGIAAILGGDVVGMVDGYPSFEGMLRSGDVRLLASFSTERMANNKTLPTVNETIKGLEATGWFAIFAPKGTSPEILEKVRAAVNEALDAPEVSSRMLGLSIFPEKMTGEELTAFLKKEQAFWSNAVKAAGVVPQ
ncbi:tripartite tricarboxylate transporter substrate binding protein [Bradyrhizobium sp. LHD-71]|uniref:Bug family tripartite tricarboxylate transporter substrate binding protein n=1 Tax=Bradyrhizobium sp. LHD-71 TaxID=3072141 RepID=UPI00280DFF85|nr:tripartite tricarboxylate transporter substrate binding protein [Bradyrhizobium sp. LHD-71]MDQ8729159.1 tripartite tricarboxylate transporter substrate binding protein [Bradyrhizobium sp. LHD-71]